MIRMLHFKFDYSSLYCIIMSVILSDIEGSEHRYISIKFDKIKIMTVAKYDGRFVRHVAIYNRMPRLVSYTRFIVMGKELDLSTCDLHLPVSLL